VADRPSFVITRGYGQCIDAMRRIDEELSWASTQKDPARVQVLREDRAAWLQLAQSDGFARFTCDLPAVSHG